VVRRLVFVRKLITVFDFRGNGIFLFYVLPEKATKVPPEFCYLTGQDKKCGNYR